jgi:drug/metabolite transporter (DMT)-like permease
MQYLWIGATLVAAAFQVARNGLQRGMMDGAGPWGATLIRFLFGLPFSAAFAAIGLLVVPATRLDISADFATLALGGAVGQIIGTATLLVSMQRAGFAVGTALQQSSIPLSAVAGVLFFQDDLSVPGWTGVALTTAGLFLLTWPGGAAPGRRPLSGALFGLGSGLAFGLSLNAFRHASLTLGSGRPVVAALCSLVIVQAAQALILTAFLAAADRRALGVVVRGWRNSLAAGLCGSIASSGWFIALALAPAASVRALGVVEAPMAAAAGGRFLKERLTRRQIFAGVAVLAGVLLTTLAR